MEVALDGGGGGGADDWRAQISEGIRWPYVSSISRALKRILSPNVRETLTNLREVAARLEGRIFTVANSMSDYDMMISHRLLYLRTALRDKVPLYDQVVLQASSSQLAQPPRESHIIRGMQQMHRLAEPVNCSDHSSAVMLLQQNCCNQQSKIIHEKRKLHEASSGGNQKKPRYNRRISNLHEDLIHRIMSFLPAREVVCTSALCARWRPLWTSAPCLDIDIAHFDKDRVKFNNFVENLLLWRGIDRLEKLRLHSFAIDAANFWIDHAIKRNVRSIEFTEDITWEPFFLNPEIIEFPSPHLKSLKLTNVILNTHVFDPLNHACPSLENLQLADSILEFSEISSSSLKTLEIIDCSLLKDLLVRTRNLVSLRFERSRSKCTLRSNFQITAAVTLCDLSNTKSIELSAPVREVAFGTVNSMFINLTSLSLGEWCLSDKLSPLISFLRHSPVLEKLKLKLRMECDEGEKTDAICMSMGISFAAQHLKKVTIHCTEGDARTDMLATMLRANATSLEDIEIKNY